MAFFIINIVDPTKQNYYHKSTTKCKSLISNISKNIIFCFEQKFQFLLTKNKGSTI